MIPQDFCKIYSNKCDAEWPAEASTLPLPPNPSYSLYSEFKVELNVNDGTSGCNNQMLSIDILLLLLKSTVKLPLISVVPELLQCRQLWKIPPLMLQYNNDENCLIIFKCLFQPIAIWKPKYLHALSNSSSCRFGSKDPCRYFQTPLRTSAVPDNDSPHHSESVLFFSCNLLIHFLLQ